MDDNLINNSLLEVSRALQPLSAVTDATKATELMKELGTNYLRRNLQVSLFH
jgi:hypothetical protein